MKMKKQYLSIIAGIVTLLTMNACTDGFEEINTNPNRLTTTEPEFIFGLSPVTTLRAIAGAPNGASRANNWFVFGNYSQMWAIEGGEAPHFSDPGVDDLWNDLYSKSLKPLYNIIDNYGDPEKFPGYKNRVAIAKIWRSYVFSILVGLYGPLPYDDACNGDVKARYNTEEEIYTGILAELKEAYETIDVNNINDVYPGTTEPFLGRVGTTAVDPKTALTRWAQFARCIRLRTAMRIADCDDPAKSFPGKPSLQSLQETAKAAVVEELNNAEKGLLIADNTGNFFMTFDNTDLNTRNPLSFIVDAMTPSEKNQNLGNLPVLHESLMMWIRPTTYNDPVLQVYVRQGDGGTRPRPVPDTWLGRPNSMGAPTNYRWPDGWVSPYANVVAFTNYGTINKEFSRTDAPYYFFSYAELCFLRAEAVLKGYWTGSKTAEAYYYEGIDARCLKYNIAQNTIDAYKNSNGIKWSTPTFGNKWSTSTSILPATVTLGEVTPYLDFLGGFTNSILFGAEDNLKRIIVQHWISLFGQNIDAWILIRRTQLIPFKPNFNASQNGGYVSGTWAYIPERMPYPGRERSVNTTETQKAIQYYLYDNALGDVQDRITFRLIFAANNEGLPMPLEGTLAYSAFPYPLPNQAMNRILSNN